MAAPSFIIHLVAQLSLVLLLIVPALADKRFVHASLASAALKYESRMRTEADPGTRPLAQWLRDGDAALARNDQRAAAKALAAAANLDRANISLLLRLSDAYGRIDARDNYSERLDLQSRVTAFAYLAYQRATTPQDEARALAVLGRALAAQSLWRPALDALKKSLEIRDDTALRAAYEELETQHGFRLLDYQIDADAASPRACFQFSENLPKKFDATPFVSMPGGVPGGVTVEGSQLCVDGLKHGERYQITLRQGIPAAIGEVLRRPAEYTLYVRDRTPSVRFTGRNYILPRTGQTGIPLVTINLSEVAVTFYRYGDRSIAQAVLADGFLGALTGSGARAVGQERGQQVWQGKLTTENRLNEEVTTAVAVNEALGSTLKPGLYIMVAQRPDLTSDDSDYETQATQWFVVSDLGLSTALNDDGLAASVRSLASAAPLADATLRLIALNNEVLATTRSDATGAAQFSAGLVNGEGGDAPALLIAEKDGDYAFINLQATAFDFTDRGVGGRAAPGALDAFVVTERGVYRSGESVHVTALLRDDGASARTDIPIHLVIERPDGVEARRILAEDGGAGGRVWRYDLTPGAMTGTYRLKAYGDLKRPLIGQTTFLVEDYVPDRLELALSSPRPETSRDAPARIDIAGRWLFGAPAAGLSLDGETIISPAGAPPAALAGYKVGLLDEEVLVQRQPLTDLPTTDVAGKASFALALPDTPPSVRPMKVEALIRLVEAGGRGVERKLSLALAEPRPWIGVKPLFGDTIGEGEVATFDVAYLGADGRLAASAGLKWQLSRIDTRFQWFRTDGRWSFDKVTAARRIADGEIAIPADKPARISARVEWGTYRLDVLSAKPGEAATSITFYAGIAGGQAPDAPDTLEVAADKPAYAPGDTVKLRITARSDAEATLYLAGERIHSIRNIKLARGANTIDITADAAWGVGTYAVLTAIRPLDEAQRRQPGRAIGVRWLALDTTARALPVTIDAPAVVRPRQKLTIPLKLGITPGEEAFVTLAAVDIGILNLTGYKAPDANAYYYGQRLLATEFRDIYGYLIDGMQGNRGRLRSGGDGNSEGLQASPPTQAPLALFSGIVKVDANGQANVTFDLPAFTGSMRVMALAWSKNRLGHASADVIVRDPLAITVSAPRFLAVGDRSRLLVEVNNVEGPAGDYRLTVATNGPVRLATGAGPHILKLTAGGHTAMTMPITVQGIGSADFTFTLTGPNSIGSAADLKLPLRPANAVIAQRILRSIPPNGSLEFGSELLTDIVPGTGAVNLSVASYPALDDASSLEALARYPLACTEQSVSRALPLLYLSQAGASPGAQDDMVRLAIDRILGRQAANGSFGLWSAGGSDLWLDALVGDFLTRARERGVAVPANAFALVLDRLRNATVNQGERADDAIAYALYVLARNGRPVIGDLRYLADTGANDSLSALGRGQVAAALALLGDRRRAEPLFTKAVDELEDVNGDEPGRNDYGSTLRDGAALATLISESGLPARALQRTLSAIDKARGERRTLSTQEHMWIALAARAAREAGNPLAFSLQGTAYQGPLARRYLADDLAAGRITLVNRTATPLPATLTVTGSPLTSEPATTGELKLERSYVRLDGTKVDPKSVRQNDRLVVLLKVADPDPPFAHLLITDPLPAGFEIDSPTLVDSSTLTGTPAGDNAPVAVYKEFRDDRFIAAFQRGDEQPAEFTVAYIVRAVAPGRFAHPSASLEDMYHPDRFARTAAGTVEVTIAP